MILDFAKYGMSTMRYRLTIGNVKNYEYINRKHLQLQFRAMPRNTLKRQKNKII